MTNIMITLSFIYQLRGTVVRAFACEASRLDVILNWVNCIRSTFKSCADDKETVSGLYVNDIKINSVVVL